MSFTTIAEYNKSRSTAEDREIFDRLRMLIDHSLPDAESKIWHGHPVWFLNGNPIVGYSKLKTCIRLLFWSGQSFAVAGLTPSGKFKAAEARFTDMKGVAEPLISAWCADARAYQWDYKNIVKRRGRLEPLVGV